MRYHLCGHVHMGRVAKVGETVCLSVVGAQLLELRW